MDQLDKELQTAFEQLNRERQQQLLDFARFLLDQQGPLERVISEPEQIPRPQQESVVAAMKRLNRTYPMLDKQHLLNEASSLMAEHMLQGRAAVEVIDELEAVFSKYYKRLKES